MNVEKERRIAERQEASFEVTYVHQGDYLISQSKDISVDGIFLRTEEPAPMGERTSLSFALPDGRQLQLQGEVVWANSSGNSADAGMAVRFIDTPEETRQDILAMIRKIAVLGEN